MGDASYFAKIFEEEMRKKSVNKGDFIQEWQLANECHGASSKCICTHDIQLNFYIQNKITGERVIIGSDCVERWLHPQLQCKGCNEPLGCIMRRIKDKDFYCRSCKVETRKTKERTVNQYSTWKLAFPGPWKGLTFRKISENGEWVEKLANTPKWKGSSTPSYAYNSLHAFQKYADAKFDFEIEYEESEPQVQ